LLSLHDALPICDTDDDPGEKLCHQSTKFAGAWLRVVCGAHRNRWAAGKRTGPDREGGCPWKRLSVDVTRPPAPARPRVSRRGRANPATGTGHARRRPATPGNACTCRGVRGKARHRPAPPGTAGHRLAPPGTAGHRLAPPGTAWHRLAPTAPGSRPQCLSLRNTSVKLKPYHGGRVETYADGQIGRASCREREEGWGGAVA